jgi:hypothetical protein
VEIRFAVGIRQQNSIKKSLKKNKISLDFSKLKVY